MTFVCEHCARDGGFEGDPPDLWAYRVRVTYPTDAAVQNPEEKLCGSHASVVCNAYIGFGWGFNAITRGAKETA